MVVAISRLPLHARNTETAQTVLGPSCAEVQETPIRDVPEDDDHEYFVIAWCWHPSFIDPECIIFIPEPHVAVGENENLLRGMRYVLRCRVVAYQDWSTPPGSPIGGDNGHEGDDGAEEGGDVEDVLDADDGPPSGGDGSDDSDAGFRADRLLGSGQRQRSSVLVGSLACPFAVGKDPVSPARLNRGLHVHHQMQASPSLSNFRSRGTPAAPGMVGQFINVAPYFLQAARGV